MITLTSDFGTPYPAAMKGVITARTDARLIDVSHDLPGGDVRTAAFWLREILPYFPPAVHLVVVDPGVGTDRNALVIRAGEHVLVGPDNGVLLPVVRRLVGASESGSIPDLADVAALTDESDEFESFVIDDSDAASSTFHGRDVFAPAAAMVHEAGISSLETIDSLDPVDHCVDLSLPVATEADDRIRGEVLVVDDFGNVITNVPGTVLTDLETIVVNGERVPVGDTFGTVEPGERVAIVGSHGYVELDVNRGRGDEAFGLEPGDDICLE